MNTASNPLMAAVLLGLTPGGLAVVTGARADTFGAIAAKYKGDPKAAAALAARVRSGGKGVWGTVPMPPADARTISDADLRSVIGWILAP